MCNTTSIVANCSNTSGEYMDDYTAHATSPNVSGVGARGFDRGGPGGSWRRRGHAHERRDEVVTVSGDEGPANGDGRSRMPAAGGKPSACGVASLPDRPSAEEEAERGPRQAMQRGRLL